MSSNAKRSDDFKNYPFLEADEFAETCHQLDRRYTQATLGLVRRRWKLRVCRALDISFSASAEYATYIQIIRPLDDELDDGDLSACLDNFSFGNDSADTAGTEDQEMMEAEESDSVWLQALCIQYSAGKSSQGPGGRSKGAKAARLWRCHVRDPSPSDLPSTLPLV